MLEEYLSASIDKYWTAKELTNPAPEQIAFHRRHYAYANVAETAHGSYSWA